MISVRKRGSTTSLSTIGSIDFPQRRAITIQTRLRLSARLLAAFAGCADIVVRIKIGLLKRWKAPPVGFSPRDNPSALQ